MLYSGIIDDVVEIALSAGNIILRFYDDQFSIMQKSDGSPVTVADQAAEDYIIPALTRLTPDIPIIAEERVAMGQIPDVSGGTFWLVDPSVSYTHLRAHETDS